MGGSKKQTIGYHYKWLLHFGWCRGVIDALLELRGGDAPFFQGRLTSSQRITINKPELWGGEKGEGGITGDWDILFGEPTQAPNDYLTSVLGAQQSGHRGKFTTVARGGRFGAFTPSPKTVSAKVERILTDWQDDTVWYLEKAVIAVSKVFDSRSVPMWRYLVVSRTDASDYSSPTFDDSTWAQGQSPFASFHDLSSTYWNNVTSNGFYATPGTNVPQAVAVWMRGSIFIADASRAFKFRAWVDNGIKFYVNGIKLIDDYGSGGHYLEATLPVGSFVSGSNAIAVRGQDDTYTSSTAWFYFDFSIDDETSLNTMNPAHVLYESITRDEMQGEPAGLINDASFRAAADQLYSEGFGICTTYDSESETPEQFQQRICNLIAGNLTQSRTDGLYYLDLIRAVSDPSTLPIITEDDVKTFKQTPWVGSEAVNLIQVEWFDPQAKQVRTTQPVYSAAGIQDVGSPNSDVRTYHEVASNSLAVRLAARELAAASTPLSKIDLTLLPKWRTLRAGTNVRLQLPSEGISDMVLVMGEVAQGTLKDGSIAVSAVQNVFSFPDTVFIQQQSGSWVDPDQPPTASANQVAFEAPYIELVAALSSSDLTALPSDAGYLALVATRPTFGIHYEVNTAAAGESYVAYGIGDWVGSVIINEAAAQTDTAFTYTSASDLSRLEVGGWALWDSEIVRVDAVDETTGAITLARGCADTVPVTHAAGSLLVYAGEWVASDQRQYVGGDVVRAKLLTITASSKLDAATAPELSVTMNDRASRPYPPGLVQIGGVSYPSSVTGSFTVTWAHRNRVVQADQLVDASHASITPAVNTRYVLRFLDSTATLLVERTDIGDVTASVVLNYTGNVTMELYTIDDLGVSYQKHEIAFAYTPPGGTVTSAITAAAYTPVDDSTIIDGGTI